MSCSHTCGDVWVYVIGINEKDDNKMLANYIVIMHFNYTPKWEDMTCMEGQQMYYREE